MNLLRRLSSTRVTPVHEGEEDNNAANTIIPLVDRRRLALPWWQKAALFLGCDCFVAPLLGLADAGLTAEEVEQVKMTVPFTEEELQHMLQRFLELDKDESGSISLEEFMEMPEFANNPFKDRIFLAFDGVYKSARSDQRPEDRTLTFMEFLTSLSVFSENGSATDKTRFLFRLYDMDNDGKIGKEDLAEVISRIMPDAVTSEEREKVAERIFLEIDQDNRGFIDYRTFSSDVITGSDIGTRLRMQMVRK